MAEDFNHIDQIIRQKFDNFEPEPPVQVWENIRSSIPKTPPPPTSPGMLLPIIVSFSILIFISGLFHHYYNNNPEKARAEAGKTIQTASLGSTGSTTISDPGLQETFYQAASEVPAVGQEPIIAAEPSVSSVPVRMPFDQSVSADKKKKNSKSAKTTSDQNIPSRGEYKPGLVQAIKSGDLSYSEVKKYNLSLRDIRKIQGYKEESNAKPLEWSVGLFFNPEMSSCNDENIENSVSYNVSVLPRLSINRFFIQSGINTRFTHDKGNMTVDYRRYLGSYEDVYLVTFDSTENGVIPTYYTETVEVFDTIAHYAVAETKARYTYLEIPLMFGYRYSFGKFALYANAGPSASFRVGKYVPEAQDPEDNARIVNVNYQVPLRSTVDWQLLVGAGFEYQLGGKMSFSMEPTFRQSLKSEYDLAGTKGRTNSFGLRLGLNYKF
jgi:hypothetical protein